MIRLFAEDFFHVSGFFLNGAFRLVVFAFGLKAFVAGGLADPFFDLAFDILGGSFRFVLIA